MKKIKTNPFTAVCGINVILVIAQLVLSLNLSFQTSSVSKIEVQLAALRSRNAAMKLDIYSYSSLNRISRSALEKDMAVLPSIPWSSLPLASLP